MITEWICIYTLFLTFEDQLFKVCDVQLVKFIYTQMCERALLLAALNVKTQLGDKQFVIFFVVSPQHSIGVDDLDTGTWWKTLKWSSTHNTYKDI